MTTAGPETRPERDNVFATTVVPVQMGPE
jgi:hypothetical protein